MKTELKNIKNFDIKKGVVSLSLSTGFLIRFHFCATSDPRTSRRGRVKTLKTELSKIKYDLYPWLIF